MNNVKILCIAGSIVLGSVYCYPDKLLAKPPQI